MSTIIKPENLNYDHYTLEKYDSDIVKSIPGHKEMHELIQHIIRHIYEEHYDSERENDQLLELGVGTGLTTEAILDIIPKTECYVVDFSKNMLDGARKRLSGYDVTFANQDYSDMEFPQNNNIVVSVVSIHHQETDDDKQLLFKRIYDSLTDRGVFIFGDLFTYKDPHKAAFNDALHYHHLVEMHEDEESLREWAYHHKYLNRCSNYEDQMDWLGQAGFSELIHFYEKFNTNLILAIK